MANVVTRTGKHVIIVRLKDNPEPLWIANPNRISVADLIQENLNASNSNKNNADKPTYKPSPREDRFNRDDESEPASKPASKPKQGRSSKRSSKKSDKDIATADANYAAARAAYAALTNDGSTGSATDADSQANCSSASTSDGGNPF